MEITSTEAVEAKPIQQEGKKSDVHEVWIYSMDGHLIGTEWRINTPTPEIEEST